MAEKRFVFTREIFAKDMRSALLTMDELLWLEMDKSQKPGMTFFKVHQYNGSGCGLCCMTCKLMDKHCKELFGKRQVKP
jgi:hypothetical protein